VPFVNVPFIDLLVGPQAVRPLSVLVKQADTAHELATIVADVRYLPYNGREEGLPVRLRWGHFPGNTRTYYGYVHHTEPYYDKLTNNTVKLVCLGASSTLSAPLQQSWANQTADAVVRDIVESAYLSVDVEPDSQVWPVLTATNITAWAFLKNLADKIGYRLCPLGTEVRFWSLTKLFTMAYPTAPTLNMGGELTRFRLQNDDEDSGLSAQRTVYGLDQRGGRLFAVQDDGPTVFARLGSEIPATTTVPPAPVVADTPGTAAAKLAGTASSERFTYAARGEALGDTILAPGTLAYLAGLENTQNGHWYIQGAEHDVNLRTGDYITYLDLRRDALGALAAAPQPGIITPRLRQTPAGDVVGATPPAVLVNGQWRSSWARRAS